MKRALLVSVLVVVVVGMATAQLGSQPRGYESYASDDLMVSFYYPDDWFVVEKDENLTVVNRRALADQVGEDEPDLQPGDTVMVVGVLPAMLMAMMGVPAEDVSSIVDAMFQNMISENGDVQNGDSQTHTVEGRRVASMLFDDSSEEFSGMIMVTHEQEEVIVFSVALGFRDDLVRNRDLLVRVVSTAEFTGDFSSMMGQ